MTPQAGARWKVASALLPGTTAALAAGIFIADTITEIDIAVAVLYVVAALMATRFCRPRGVVLVACGCVGLTVGSYYLMPLGGPRIEGIINTTISLVVIGLTTFLAVHIQAAETALRASEVRWRTVFETAPVGIATIG